jgi:hypothetical protein
MQGVEQAKRSARAYSTLKLLVQRIYFKQANNSTAYYYFDLLR